MEIWILASEPIWQLFKHGGDPQPKMYTISCAKGNLCDIRRAIGDDFVGLIVKICVSLLVLLFRTTPTVPSNSISWPTKPEKARSIRDSVTWKVEILAMGV